MAEKKRKKRKKRPRCIYRAPMELKRVKILFVLERILSNIPVNLMPENYLL